MIEKNKAELLADAELFYATLEEAAACAPSTLEPWAFDSLDQLLNHAADQIAKALDPSTLAEIREYNQTGPAGGDDRILDIVIGYFLEKAHDDEADPGLQWFLYPKEIGLEEVLAAPVETPAEFVQWLLSEHREKFDGSPCAGCSKPVPYDDRYYVGDRNGQRYFHPFCGKQYWVATHPSLT